MRVSRSSAASEVILIVGAGELGPVARARSMLASLRGRVRVIAVDGGWVHCQKLALTPEAIVGDFDSLPAKLHARAMQLAQSVHLHPVDKDWSDLALALKLASRWLKQSLSKKQEVVLLGVTGGREDHHHAALFDIAWAAARWPAATRVLGHASEWHFLTSKTPRTRLAGVRGRTVSIFALSARVTGLKTRGLKWDGSRVKLLRPGSQGLSNLAISGEIQVEIGSGCAVVVVPSSNNQNAGKNERS